MSRIRSIKPEFFTSEDIVSMTPLARLFYVSLWCEADREGRLDWKPGFTNLSTLDDWLGRAYHAKNTGGSVDEKFIFILQNDQAMMIEAGKRLASLTDAITQRDYVSKVHRETLTRVVERMSNG